MNRKLYLVVLFAAVAIVLCCLWLHYKSLHDQRGSLPSAKDPSSHTNITSSAPGINVRPADVPDVPGANLTHEDKEKLGKIITVFNTPIEFYGKVQDIHGSPIPAVTVHYSAADKYFGESSKYEGVSDADGFFSIRGIKGAGLYVDVYKEGFDGTKLSGASFGYGMPSGNTPPTKANPAIFVLRKKAVTEPLIVVSSRQYEIPKDGRPVGINLQSARVGAKEGNSLIVQTWVSDDLKDAKGRFSWRYRVEVPGGGLTERNDESSFQAPVDGYSPSDEINMVTTSPDWKESASREYFLKLPDGKYAHVKIEVKVGSRYNFIVMESYLNPSGSPNLEPDPTKEIKADRN